MKKIILIVICFIFFKTSIGQPYQPLLGDTSTSWKIFYTNLDLWGIDSLYTINEDTIIDTSHYKILRTFNNFVFGYIRTDSSNSKAWYYSDWEHIEKLSFDLELAVGDSFYFYGSNSFSPGWYLVDSVYWKDQRKHARFNIYTDWGEKFEFIEGVGSNMSLDYQFSSIYQQSFLLCNRHDDTLNYINNNSHFQGCNAGVGIQIAENSLLELFPNPTHGNFFITWKENAQPVDLRIYNLLGKCLFEQSIHLSETNLDLKVIANGIPGIYLLSLTPKNAKPIIQKLILY